MSPWNSFIESLSFLQSWYKKKNIERHTADIIVSWLNPKQWVIVHTSDLMMITRQSIYILSIITREMGKLKTYSPTYCIMDNGENMLNLTHTFDKIYLTGILCLIFICLFDLYISKHVKRGKWPEMSLRSIPGYELLVFFFYLIYKNIVKNRTFLFVNLVSCTIFG